MEYFIMNEDLNTTIQWLLWQMQYINENTQYKPKPWNHAMASSIDEIKPSKCHNLSKQIATTQN